MRDVFSPLQVESEARRPYLFGPYPFNRFAMHLLPASLRLFACLPVLTLFLACQAPDPAPREVLWYAQPAGEWVDALPLGNGRLGVMVFGDTATERIQLNDDSMWPADSEDWTEPAGGPADLAALRQLLLAGDHAAADALFVEKFSRKGITRSHQTLGDLFIAYDHGSISAYRRELDLSQAISRVTYQAGGAAFSQEVFVSHPHRAIVIRLTTESEAGFSADLSLSRPADQGFPTARAFVDAEGQLHLQGAVTQREGRFHSQPAPLLEGVKFETILKVVPEGGEVVPGDTTLSLKGVRQATIYLVSNSSYYEDDFSGKNQQDLAALRQVDYETLKAAHIADHRSYYDRCQLQLGETRLDSLPTDQRLQRVRDGQTDPALEALLFQYGRYLLIGSSRPGTNPANLQGLWNPHIKAPWNADYHLNINLQMNYWLADLTSLGDLNQPLFDFVDRLVENGQQTARVNFGCEGTFLPHATDLWAPTWLRANTAYWGCSVGAAGWMMQHYWQHYAFTLDQSFLKERAFPAIEQVAQFYSDWLIVDPRDSLLVSAPSTSPENRFLDAQGEPVATCLGSAMDQQIIREVFDHYLQACAILGIEGPLRDKVTAQLAQLRPGFVLGQDGRILEWDREYPEHEPGHRHMSHLYGFHPGNQVSAENDPAIFEAVRKTLDYRLDHGGAGTGWSRAWLINCSARLLDGEMAHEHIQLFFQKSLSDNLFDLHPPFQIDGNFGYTAGVAEMLLQSHEAGILRLLPALPAAWASGSVTGLKARGGLTVDLHWQDQRLEKAVIRATHPQSVRLKYQDQSVTLSLAAGEERVYAP